MGHLIKGIFFISLVFTSSYSFSQKIIQLQKQDGLYTILCKVNGLPLNFIFDTGAEDVSISLTEALFMLKNGYLDKNDLQGKEYFTDATGGISEGTKLLLKEIEFNGIKLNNVQASVVHQLKAPLLLGQSAISKLGKIEIDPYDNFLIIKEYTNANNFFLASASDSVSYSVGLSIGLNLKKNNLSMISIDKFHDGVIAGIRDDNRFISPAKAQETIQRFCTTRDYSIIDTVAYSIGLSVGKTLKKDGIIDLNTKFMNAALKDAFNEKLLLDTSTARITIQNYFSKKRKMEDEINLINGKIFLDENKKALGVIELPDGLQYFVLKQGNGQKPKLHSTIIISYEGRTIDGTVFDNTNQPTEFSIDAFILGLTEAIQLMPINSKWRIFIPPSLAYGTRSVGALMKPNSTLIYDVELLDIK